MTTLPATEDEPLPRRGRTVLTTGALGAIADLASRPVRGVVDLEALGLPANGASATAPTTGVEVRLSVVAAWDVPLPELASALRQAVVEAVEGMTGLATTVDVAIGDVTHPDGS